MHLERDSYTPLYVQLYALLKEKIAQYPHGASLPPERVLCEEYGLDRVTVRKALSMLAEEKIIERKQGRGTRVIGGTEKKGGIILFALYSGSQLVDRLGEPFYARSMDELEKAFGRNRQRLLYSKLRSSDNINALCEQMSVDGILIAGAVSEEIAEQCRSAVVPVVAYNTSIHGLPSVCVSNDAAATRAAEYLLSLGHRDIGFINVPGNRNSEMRRQAFERTLQGAGLDPRGLVVGQGDWTVEGGYAAAKVLLAQAPWVTALFAGNDSMAIGALRAANEAGLSVPGALSVVGFDGIAQSALTDPPLTTLQVDTHLMAEAAAMLLSYMIANGMCGDIHSLVSAKMLVRGTTAAPRENADKCDIRK